MSIEQWWPKLKITTQQWLIANNGDEVPPEVLIEIAEAGGPGISDLWWCGQKRPGCYLSDDATDWIEAVANGEGPDRQ